MSVATRKNVSSHMPRREQMLNERLRAASLRERFPGVQQMRIELSFSDLGARSPPSPQLHALYSAAAAFFRFACPCADCDGDFDLTEAVNSAITGNTPRKGSALVSGQLACSGMRFRNNESHQATCSMQLRFQLRCEPAPGSDN